MTTCFLHALSTLKNKYLAPRLLLAVILFLCIAPPSAAPAAPETLAPARSAPAEDYRYYGTISGTVTRRSDGAPISNVSVAIYDFVGSWWDEPESYRYTMPDGSFTIPNVYPGEYRVCAGGNEYQSACYGGRVPVRLRYDQETRNINLVLDPSTSVSGYVVENDGVTAISGAFVRIYGPVGQYHEDLSHQFGNFGFNWLNYGSGYSARAEKAGYVPDDRPDASADQDVEYFTLPRPGNAADIVFRLTRAATITGKITDQTTGGWLADASVWVYPQGGAPDDSNKVTSDASGVYSMMDLAPGKYFIKAALPGMATEFYGGAYSEATTVPLNLSSGSNLRNINIALSPSATISGHVYHTDGYTECGGKVSLLTMDGEALYTAWPTSTGGFTLGGVREYEYPYVQAIPPGDYLLQVQNSNCTAAYYPNAMTIEAATPIHVEAGQQLGNVNFLLEQGGRITGDILTADGGTLNGDLYLQAIDAGGQIVAEIGVHNLFGDHPFTLYGLPPGQVRLRAYDAEQYQDGYYPHARTWETAEWITITGAETVTDKDITLNRAASVLGQVVFDDSSYEFRKTVVTFKNLSDGQEYTTEQWGGYRFKMLPPGDYIAWTPGNDSYASEYYPGVMTAAEAQPLHLAVGQELQVDFRIDPFDRFLAGPDFQSGGYVFRKKYSSDEDDFVPTSTLASVLMPPGAAPTVTNMRLQHLSTFLTALPPYFRPLGFNYLVEGKTTDGKAVERFSKPYIFTLDIDPEEYPHIEPLRWTILICDQVSKICERASYALDIPNYRITARLDRPGIIVLAEYRGPIHYARLPQVMKP